MKKNLKNKILTIGILTFIIIFLTFLIPNLSVNVSAQEEVTCSDFECSLEENCYPIGYRISDGDIYCGEEEGEVSFIEQKDDGATCEENYQCRTNLCQNGVCYSGFNEENKGFIDTILGFFEAEVTKIGTNEGEVIIKEPNEDSYYETGNEACSENNMGNCLSISTYDHEERIWDYFSIENCEDIFENVTSAFPMTYIAVCGDEITNDDTTDDEDDTTDDEDDTTDDEDDTTDDEDDTTDNGGSLGGGNTRRTMPGLSGETTIDYSTYGRGSTQTPPPTTSKDDTTSQSSSDRDEENNTALKKWFWITLIIIVLLVGIFLIFWKYLKKRTLNDTKTKVPKDNPQEIITKPENVENISNNPNVSNNASQPVNNPNENPKNRIQDNL